MSWYPIVIKAQLKECDDFVVIMKVWGEIIRASGLINDVYIVDIDCIEIFAGSEETDDVYRFLTVPGWTRVGIYNTRIIIKKEEYSTVWEMHQDPSIRSESAGIMISLLLDVPPLPTMDASENPYPYARRLQFEYRFYSPSAPKDWYASYELCNMRFREKHQFNVKPISDLASDLLENPLLTINPAGIGQSVTTINFISNQASGRRVYRPHLKFWDSEIVTIRTLPIGLPILPGYKDYAPGSHSPALISIRQKFDRIADVHRPACRWEYKVISWGSKKAYPQDSLIHTPLEMWNRFVVEPCQTVKILPQACDSSQFSGLEIGISKVCSLQSLRQTSDDQLGSDIPIFTDPDTQTWELCYTVTDRKPKPTRLQDGVKKNRYYSLDSITSANTQPLSCYARLHNCLSHSAESVTREFAIITVRIDRQTITITLADITTGAEEMPRIYARDLTLGEPSISEETSIRSSLIRFGLGYPSVSETPDEPEGSAGSGRNP